MEIKSFYKNQRELAAALSKVIDMYWSSQIPEKELIESVLKIVDSNKSKVYTEDAREFTTVLRQQCGKRRLDVVSQIIENRR